jgi:UPF0716 protein FxsA
LFIVVPLIEALLLARIGDAIGWTNTIALVIGTGIVGAWLFKLEGGRAWREWQGTLARGEAPREGVLGGVLLLLGGALLITPGVITDVCGLLLLLPPTRRALSRWLLPRVMDRFVPGVGAGSRDNDHGVRVFHFEMGSIDPRDPTSFVPHADEGVVPRRAPAIRPKVIDVDFEVVERDD